MTTHDTPGYSEAPRALVNVKAARELLGGISRPTLSRIRRRGELAEVKIGRRVFFRPDDLDDYIERHREAVGP